MKIFGKRKSDDPSVSPVREPAAQANDQAVAARKAPPGPARDGEVPAPGPVEERQPDHTASDGRQVTQPDRGPTSVVAKPVHDEASAATRTDRRSASEQAQQPTRSEGLQGPPSAEGPVATPPSLRQPVKATPAPPAPADPEGPSPRRKVAPRGPEPARQEEKPLAEMPVAGVEPPLFERLAKNIPGPVRLEKAFEALGVDPRYIAFVNESRRDVDLSISATMSDFGAVSHETVAQALAASLGLGYFEPRMIDEIDIGAINEARLTSVAQPNYVPVAVGADDVIVMAVAEPADRAAAANAAYPKKVIHCIASAATIQTAYRRLFARTEQAVAEAFSSDPTNNDYYHIVLSTLIRHACFVGASDIHFTPLNNFGLIRLRIDGVLQLFRAIKKEAYQRLLNVIRNDANIQQVAGTTMEGALDPPEDLQERYAIRVQVSDTVREESAVLRLLDRHGAMVDFAALGFDPESEIRLGEIVHSSEGLFVVTGPTGSGKSTTLYALMRLRDPIGNSIQTIENPVEFHLGSWHQHEIKRGSGSEEGNEWEKWMKGLLRNDPDVVLLGEIRDKPTSQAAVKMAGTGHMVLTTLHTNSATKTITRLSEMGLNMPSLSDVLRGVLAQRLLRKLCRHCRIEDDREETAEELQALEALRGMRMTPYRASPNGCRHCNYQGFRGRRSVYEVLFISDEETRRTLAEARSGADLLRYIKPEHRMWGRGLQLVAKGETDIDELRRRVVKE